MLYEFGPFILDCSRHGLYRDEELTPLEPRAYEVLVYLVRHRDRLITYDELMEQVWDESFVDTSVVSRSVSVLRRVLGDDRKSQRFIQTRWGQGYQFVAEVAEMPASAPDVPTVVAAPLEALCVACASPLPTQAVFCSACGQRQDVAVSASPTLRDSLARDETRDAMFPPAPATAPAERRPMSVVYAAWDEALVRHWELDDLPERLAGLQQWVEQTLGAFGGTLLALNRTSLLMGFGVPVVQEEHALRALAAAIALRNQGAGMPLGSPTPLDANRHLRLAAGAGLVVVAAPETPAAQTPQVFGEIQDEVQRLATRAVPGALIINAALARLIHPMMPLNPPYRAGDTLAASQGYRVDATEVPDALARPERPTHLAGVFVGRDAELALLHTQLAQAQQGQGGLVGFVGEAGLGKSRLLREFRQRLQDKPLTYLAGGVSALWVCRPVRTVSQTRATVLSAPCSRRRAADATGHRRQLAGLGPGAIRVGAVPRVVVRSAGSRAHPARSQPGRVATTAIRSHAPGLPASRCPAATGPRSRKSPLDHRHVRGVSTQSSRPHC